MKWEDYAKESEQNALKDAPAGIFESQLAAIEAVRTIFKNEKIIKSIPQKTSKTPLIPRKALPEQYRTPTSKGGQENQPTITSKGALQQTVHKITKNKT